MFNIYDIVASNCVGNPEMETICDRLGLQVVPEVLDDVTQLAQKKSQLNPKAECEDLVWLQVDFQPVISKGSKFLNSL